MIYLLAMLAVYRIAKMVSAEDGPWDAFTQLRTLVRNRYGHDAWQTRGINCPLCISFWAGWLIALLLPWQGVGHYVITTLALSGATVLIEAVLEMKACYEDA